MTNSYAFGKRRSMRTLDQAIEHVPFKLADLQYSDLQALSNHTRVGLFWEVGVGKTMGAAALCMMWGREHNIVIMPHILLEDWRRWINTVDPGASVEIYYGPRRYAEQLRAKWVLTSHAIFRDDFREIFTAMGGHELTIVVDECFVAGTPVLTPSGPQPIETLEVGDLVLTSAGPRPILHKFEHVAPSTVTLELSNGTNITCTSNHPVFSDNGWVEAGSSEGRWLLHSSALPNLQRGVQEVSTLTRALCAGQEEAGRKLLNILQDETVVDRAERQDARDSAGPSRRPCSGTFCCRGSAQASLCRAQSGCVQDSSGAETQAVSSRRERDGANTCGTTANESDACAGICVEPCCESGQASARLPDELQGGLRAPNQETCAGSRRELTQGVFASSSGSQERAEAARVRVVRVSDNERAGPVKVWNLEVEGCPHYFAGGVLVHNCHALKSVQSILFKRVDSLSRGQNLILMTGTPTNKPADAYSYIKLKTPTLYRSMGHFENMHVAERDFFGTVTEWRDLESVSKALYIQAIRRNKQEVFGDRPKPIYSCRHYNLAPKHAQLYKKLAEEQLLMLPDGGRIDATIAQRMYHALQQIVVSYDHFSGDPAKRSESYTLLDQIAEEVGVMEPDSSKIIVWTWYRRSSANITRYLQEKYGAQHVTAAYSGVNSAEAIQRFQYDPACRWLVGQPGSCGVGFNPQAVCWEQLFMETPTIPLMVRQAVGRVDRMGQMHVPTIRFGIASGTIQEYLVDRLLSNDDLVTEVEALPQSLRSAILGLA